MELIKEFLSVQNQLKVYHWQTKSYSRHKASDEFVSKLTDLVDQYIEVYQGNYGVITLPSGFQLSLKNISDGDITQVLVKFGKFLTLLESKSNPDLNNIRDEILGLVNQTIYLFTLS